MVSVAPPQARGSLSCGSSKTFEAPEAPGRYAAASHAGSRLAGLV